jgi:hypothetical protein
MRKRAQVPMSSVYRTAVIKFRPFLPKEASAMSSYLEQKSHVIFAMYACPVSGADKNS